MLAFDVFPCLVLAHAGFTLLDHLAHVLELATPRCDV